MIVGTHFLMYSQDPEADRAFLRDKLGFPFVDDGRGWLIFALPPAVIAVHPQDNAGGCAMYLMCDDIEAFISEIAGKGVACTPIEEEPWGRLTRVRLPGGNQLGIYQPSHTLAISLQGNAS